MSAFVFDARAARAEIEIRQATRESAAVSPVLAADEGAACQQPQKPQKPQAGRPAIVGSTEIRRPQQPQTAAGSQNRTIKIYDMIVGNEDRRDAHVQSAVPAVLAVEAIDEAEEPRATPACAKEVRERTASAGDNALTAIHEETSFAEHETAEVPKLDRVAAAVFAADELRPARICFRLKVDGDDLTYEVSEDPAAYSIIDILRPHKDKIIELLRGERRAVVRWINDHFQSSPVGQCVLCGSNGRENDPFVAIFVGENRADAHASCYPAWIAEQEAKARFALGIETPVDARAGRDASYVGTRAR